MLCSDISAPMYLIFSDTVPRLLYYSHIPTAIVALSLGTFIFLKNRTLISGILLGISVTFSLWLFLNLIVWTNIDSGLIMFAWSLFGILYTLIYVLSLYLVYVFIAKKDLSLRGKALLMSLLIPVVFLAPAALNLQQFDLVNCEAVEGTYYTFYYYFVGLLIFFWILLFAIIKYRKETDYDFKKQIVLFTAGIELFLLSFFLSGFLASYLVERGLIKDFGIEQYGIFGMTFFMGMLGYIIVKFKAFDIKLIGAQALVVAQFVLIGSMLTVVTSLTNYILVGVTLVITLVVGWILIRSVRNEIERKEELQKISDSLAIANQRLKELDTAKSEFISIASHQLRTPLTAIKGYISLLLEGSYGKMPAPIQDVLDKIYTINSRLVQLVEDLLNISRIEAGRIQYNFEPTQIEPLVAELVDMFAFTAKNKQLALKIHLPKKTLPKLTIDPNKIKEVVSNLIDNALKYTKKGSVTVSVEAGESAARIIVSDTGIGIHPEEKEKLFEKFIRSKETTKLFVSGTGLGLYVGKNFVEAHGGKIWAESDGPGKGSRFIVELPFANPKAQAGVSEQTFSSGRGK